MIRTRLTYVRPAATLKRDMRQALKPALQEAVEFWHGEYLPGHFDRSARQKYGYQARSTKYIKRKLRKTRQAADLVFSGKLKDQAKRQIRLSGTAKAARGVLTVPKYAYQYRQGQPDKAAELVAVTDAEAQALAERVQAAVTGGLQTQETHTA